MIRKIFISSLVIIICLVSLVAVFKHERIWNLYRYTIYDEPYVNRTFRINHNVVSMNEPIFEELKSNRDLDDRRGHAPDYYRPAAQQLTLETSSQGLKQYQAFLDEYHGALNRHKKRNGHLPDKLAFKIMGLVYKYYKKNLNSELRDFDIFRIEDSYRSEDFVYYVINNKTACGTTGEATVSLLRGAGFKARLMRYSLKPDYIQANHVFAEFYSEERGRWIMLEPMINAVPLDENGYEISTMEMLASPLALERINQLWIDEDEEAKYQHTGVVWFNRKGPITNVYYFSGSEQSLMVLSNSVDHSP